MGDQSSENYLDNLLSSISSFVEDRDAAAFNKEIDGSISSTSEQDFLRQFENELESEAYDDYISDFEMELEADQREEKDPYAREKEDTDVIADDDESLEDMLANMEKLSAEPPLEESDGMTMDTDDPDIGSLEDLDMAVDAFDVPPETDDMGVVDFSAENLEIDTLGTDSIDSDGTAEADVTDIGEDMSDLMDLLDEDNVAGIEELPAKENSGVEELGGLDDLGLDGLDGLEDIQEATEEEPQSASSDGGDTEQSDELGEAKKKMGFLAKLKLILFGEDDEEEVEGSLADGMDISELSDANQELLKELTAGDEKPDKKAKKEKKKKEKKEKKPKEKKEKKPKKEKPPKPKKEKKPKEKDTSPPLKKGSVLLIFFMAGSLTVLVFIGTELTTYKNSLNETEKLYNKGSFTEAYEAIKGLKVKEADEQLYNKVATLAAISSKYEAFVTFNAYGRNDLAFDSLVCAAGRCGVNEKNAQEYNCEMELETLRVTIENELKDKYNMSIEEAMELYSLSDRTDYTIALQKKLVELGLD